ncbi:hypothetical protein F2Q68_00041730 [Brassica cretica]|uniref:Uncharacterized protein n=1 Tax=Brassica cretica TaxID=69181 RepID=A0A8S9MHN4_BRACR|nr:hypothetical protein F2Q68_00041730 [Brassica cretica]
MEMAVDEAHRIEIREVHDWDEGEAGCGWGSVIGKMRLGIGLGLDLRILRGSLGCRGDIKDQRWR